MNSTEMVTLSRAECDELLRKSAGYTERNRKLEWLMEQVRLAKRKPVGIL